MEKKLTQNEKEQSFDNKIKYTSYSDDILDFVVKYKKKESFQILSGYKNFDNISSFNFGDFVVFAGKPDTGKTSLLANLSKNMLSSHKENKLAYVSLDKNKNSFIARFNSLVCEISINDSYQSEILTKNKSKIVNFNEHIYDRFFLIDENVIEKLIDILTELKLNGLNIIFIDFIQLFILKNKQASSKTILNEVCFILKKFARDNSILIVCTLNLETFNLMHVVCRYADSVLLISTKGTDYSNLLSLNINLYKSRQIKYKNFVLKFNPSMGLIFDDESDKSNVSFDSVKCEDINVEKNKVFDTMESLREKLSIRDNIKNDGNFRNKNEEYKQVDESYEFDEFNESDKILVYDSLNNIDQKYDIHDKNNNQPKVNPVIINSENLNIETDKGAHPIEKFNKEFPKK